MDWAGGNAVHICSGASVFGFSVVYLFKSPGSVLRATRPPSNKNPSIEPESRTAADENGLVHQTVESNADNQEPQSSQDPTGYILNLESMPHNVNNAIFGTTLIWIGWFGFNGGSALGANLRAVSATVSTNVAAVVGGMTTLLIRDGFKLIFSKLDALSPKSKGRQGVIEFCDGAVAGLVAITPAAGYVSSISF
jgi:ammonium transporter, Amt family